MLFLYRIISPGNKIVSNKKLFVIWTSHSYRSLKTFGHEELALQHDSGGWFDFVYTLYPVLGAHPIDKEISFKGPIRFTYLSPKHLYIEAKLASLPFLKYVNLCNTILSQVFVLFSSARIIRKENVSIIRANDPFITGVYAYILSRMTGRPFGLRVGANYDLLFKSGTMIGKKIFKFYFIQKIIARFVFSRAEFIMAATQDYLNYALNNGAPHNCSVVTRFGNFIDSVHLHPSSMKTDVRSLFALEKRPFGIYVGRLTKVKHADDLVLIAKEIKQLHPEAALVLIGDGDLMEAMKEQAKNLNVSENIFFLGKQKQEIIASLLPYSVAYLATHSGRSLVEAAFSGIPLIAYDFEWHSEIVKNGLTGELVGYRNYRAMAVSFCRMLENPDVQRKLGRQARKLAFQLMDPEAVRAIEHDVYAKVFSDACGNKT